MRHILFLTLIFFSVTGIFGQISETLENLGPNINSPQYLDCIPCLSPDGKVLYYSRKISDAQDYDIYCSHLQPDKTWGLSAPIKELNNNKLNKVNCVSADGNTLWVNGTYGDNPSDNGMSVTHLTKNGWSAPKSLIFNDIAGNIWGNHSFTLSSDKKIMILSLNADLYLSFNVSEDVWSKPIKLPDNLNTSTYEYTPFLASDDKTLYFSSGGHGGFGENDIFKSTRLDDTWLVWSDPVNLGKPINSTNWESYFYISAQGDYAYVYRLGPGNGDLYRVKLKEEARPDPTMLVTGVVLNAKTKTPVAATINFEDLEKKVKISEATTDPITGTYTIVLTRGKKYGLYAQVPNFFAVNENIDLTSLNQYKEIKKDLTMVPIEVGQTVRLNNVFFDFSKSEITANSISELGRVIEFLNKNPTSQIEISGHTDNIGEDASNLKLSTERAHAVKAYLMQNGIAQNRIVAKGYGKTKPMKPNDTDEGRQFNRRVEFTINKL